MIDDHWVCFLAGVAWMWVVNKSQPWADRAGRYIARRYIFKDR